ncbi:hypothetical protein, partial [Corynebacterium stationis]|uniref:hypothetical protein n=1 Tax=Corynebacterium stationis TaxID=1705 RepID=UPI00321FC1DB
MINHSRSLARLSVELRCFSMLPNTPDKNCATDNPQLIVRKPKGEVIFIIDSLLRKVLSCVFFLRWPQQRSRL